MSTFLLDTNVPSDVPSESIRSNPDPRVDLWIHGQDDDKLFLSVITLGELRKGICLAPSSNRRSQL